MKDIVENGYGYLLRSVTLIHSLIYTECKVKICFNVYVYFLIQWSLKITGVWINSNVTVSHNIAVTISHRSLSKKKKILAKKALIADVGRTVRISYTYDIIDGPT